MISITKEENPWDIKSLYELQYFNCGSCVYKNHFKQELINHAYEFHPEVIVYLNKIQDDSIINVDFPWDINKIETKEEPIENENSHEEIPRTPEEHIQDIDEIFDPLDNFEFNENKFLKNEEEFVEDKEQFKCDHCDKILVSAKKLYRHNNRIHKGIKHNCYVCSKGFVILVLYYLLICSCISKLGIFLIKEF